MLDNYSLGALSALEANGQLESKLDRPAASTELDRSKLDRPASSTELDSLTASQIEQLNCRWEASELDVLQKEQLDCLMACLMSSIEHDSQQRERLFQKSLHMVKSKNKKRC